MPEAQILIHELTGDRVKQLSGDRYLDNETFNSGKEGLSVFWLKAEKLLLLKVRGADAVETLNTIAAADTKRGQEKRTETAL